MTSRFRYSLVKRDHPFPMSALRMLRCVRCGKPGHGQWKTCADGNFHVLCGDCDAKLNALILYFVRHPKMKVMMHRYQEKLIAELQGHLTKLEAGWQPIETAPKDNKRPLLIARFNDNGTIQDMDYGAIWASDRESWEIPEEYWFWSSMNGRVEEPSHWMYEPDGFARIEPLEEET
jgi:hypothetical protein